MTLETPYNILVSYAYMSAPILKLLESLVLSKKINLMIDSGAFSAFRCGKKILLENYASFLKDYGYLAEKYVMLDSIGNAEQTRANYEKMLNLGLNPMWVVTMYDQDYSFLREAVKQNPNICVAGGATTKGVWMQQRFLKIYKESEQKAKIHGLAYVTSSMYSLPLASVDSSTWSSGSRYGWYCCWNMLQQRFDRIAHSDIRKQKAPDWLMKNLRSLGYTEKDLCREKKLGTISFEVTLKGYIDFQKSAYLRNRKLFLAMGTERHLSEYVNMLNRIKN